MVGAGRATIGILAIVLVGFAGWFYHLLGWVTTPPQQDQGLLISFDVSPAGDRVVFSAVDGDLYLLHLPTRQVERITQTEALEGNPAFAPDGRVIAYSAATGTETSGIFLRDLQSGETRQLNDGDGKSSDGMPGFAPDGKSLVFARSAKRHLDTGGFQWEADPYVVGRDGNQPRRLSARPHSFIEYPRFDRDGRSIVYTAADGLSRGEIYRQSLQPGSAPKAVGGAAPSDYRGGAWASQAQLSRDGRTLAFISDRDRAYRYQVIVARPDGTGARTLDVTGISSYNRQPVPLPNEQGVYFLALAGSPSRQSSFSLCRVDLGGANPTIVADGGLFTAPLTWAQKAQPK